MAQTLGELSERDAAVVAQLLAKSIALRANLMYQPRNLEKFVIEMPDGLRPDIYNAACKTTEA